MSRLELPDEAYAILASPKKVPERKRRRYIAAMTDVTSSLVDLPQKPGPVDPEHPHRPPEMVPDERYFTSVQMAATDALGDALILCLVREWSFGDVTAEVLADLPADAFDALFRACSALAPDLTPDYSPDPDPKARTGGPPSAPPELSKAEGISAIPSFAATS